MDNFCPNCGKPLEPNSKFCPYCGQRLENELSINSGDSDVKLKSRQGIKKSGIIILFLLLFIVGAGAVGFYIYHNKQQNIAAVNKMPKKDLAGLSIVYAHNHYKNLAWDKTYNEALKGNMVVQRTKQIDINGATITAKGNSYIYVINNRVVFTTDKNKKNSDSKLVLSDGKRTLGQVNTIEAYNEIKKNNLKQLNKINRIRQVPAVPVRKLAIMAALSHAKSNDLEESIDLNLKDHSTDLYNGGEYYRL
ncbi:zinc ribbon domain-containing protein [Lactobacillus kefiranofaciens]|nr:zinc ribbon domain-containing protein [Lactobacillus kefiranofaciens]MDH5100037.1 zinc ribbon domain-containing protein [Lactobacillus kefiranofaciens]